MDGVTASTEVCTSEVAVPRWAGNYGKCDGGSLAVSSNVSKGERVSPFF